MLKFPLRRNSNVRSNINKPVMSAFKRIQNYHIIIIKQAFCKKNYNKDLGEDQNNDTAFYCDISTCMEHGIIENSTTWF